MTCDQTCATCIFWERQGPQLANADRDPSCPADLGTCHFAPPVLAPSTGVFPMTVWPRTHADRWCGGWEPTETADPSGGEVVVMMRRKAA